MYESESKASKARVHLMAEMEKAQLKEVPIVIKESNGDIRAEVMGASKKHKVVFYGFRGDEPDRGSINGLEMEQEAVEALFKKLSPVMESVLAYEDAQRNARSNTTLEIQADEITEALIDLGV